MTSNNLPKLKPVTEFLKKPFSYLPKQDRKKILLICDDIKVHSGVATVAKEIVSRTSQHFNWAQIAGAIKHPDKGKKLELSNWINTENGINDSSVVQYPVDGYGSPEILRQIIDIEQPDALMIFTDPRYFSWLFDMENEIRKNIPIIYLNIWDDLPYPLYNRPFYESCDLLLGISKQTVNINKQVLGDKAKDKMIAYLPHGLDAEIYYPVNKDEPHLESFKNHLFKGKQVDFTIFFNSRNMRRKQIPDTILAFRLFLDKLEENKPGSSKTVRMILHTEIVTKVGTDLIKVKEALLGDKYYDNIVFSPSKISQEQMNYLYNISDVQILITSNEGWGLTLTESMLTGTPFIANVTGGMQDQMRFTNENGKWIDFNKNFPSNHFGTYKSHGEWVLPVYPSNTSLQGSPETPYIFDDRVDYRDVADRMMQFYNMDPLTRKERGMAGRQWAISEEAGFTSIHQAKRFIYYVDELFNTWNGKEKYELINANEYKGQILDYNLIY